MRAVCSRSVRRLLTAGLLLLALVAVALPDARAQAGPFDPADPPTEAIVGGGPIPITDAPYQVMVAHLPSGGPGALCGGALLRPNVVMTAGHCISGKTVGDFVVFAGNRDPLNQPGGQARTVASAVIHPNYNAATPPGGGAWDIALLFLNSSVPLSNTIRTISVATPAEVAAATTAVTGGWGFTSDGGSISNVGLKQVSVSVYTDTQCTNLFVSGGASVLHRPDRELCAGPALPTVPNYGNPIGSCNGDSGGPLVIDTPRGRRVAGLTSWVFTCGVVPAVYAEAPRFRTWLFDTLPKKECAGVPVTVDLGLGMEPTSGPDVIGGTPNGDVADGGAGDDIMCGLDGNDMFWGGPGADRLFAGPGWDNLAGGTGDDRLWGGIGNDELYGGDGDDVIYGMDGDDAVEGGIGNDELWGGPGADDLAGDSGIDRLFGVTGNDLLNGGSGDDLVYSGDGDDQAFGGPDNDRIWGGLGADQLDAGDGNDFVYGLPGPDTIVGGDGDDQLFGGDGADSIDGGLGNDYIDGRAGTDVCTGGGGLGDQLISCP